MFKKLFGGKDQDQARVLDAVSKLLVGDIITLKHRNEIPAELQGQDLEVTGVATYQYASYTSTEFTVKTAENRIFFVSEDDEDGEISLCFSKKASQNEVLEIFDEGEFGLLWDEDEHPVLNASSISGFEDWVCEQYRQSTKFGQGFYYNRDCRTQTLSSNVSSTDNGEEFQLQECEGSDDCFGVSAEIWEDGSTDVYLQLYTNTDVVEQFFPRSES